MPAATFFDGIGWREGVVALVDGRVRLQDAVATAGLPRLDGVVVGGFTDHHVHLQLVDHSPLAGSRLGRVVDLGGNPDVVRRLAVHQVRIEFGGAFLTAPGGYPSDRSWAPEGSVREIADADAAAAAVTEMAAAGASCIKVTSNGTAGPVFSDELLRTIVGLAADGGLLVVAHAEGAGEAERVVGLGAARLAHAPFTERLDDSVIERQAASASWISTLAITRRPRARDRHRQRPPFPRGGWHRALRHRSGQRADAGRPEPARDHRPPRAGGLDDAALPACSLPGDLLDPASAPPVPPGGTPAAADPLDARPLTPADLKV